MKNTWTMILMFMMFCLMVACLYSAYVIFNLGGVVASIIPCLIAVACGIFIVHDFLKLRNNK